MSRFFKILSITRRYALLSLLAEKHENSTGLSILSFFLDSRKAKSQFNRGERVRLALEALGPVFIKFGQLLSTRRDLFPEDIVNELAKLQDNVPPFPGERAKTIIEETFGKPTNELFTEFSITPLASASIAQVHKATLPTGEKVVVKVLRPKIKTVISRDIALMKALAKLAMCLSLLAQKLKLDKMVLEFEHTLVDELDLLTEAANASFLRKNFDNDPALSVPKVYWEYCYDNIMVSKRVHGTPIANMAELQAKEVDLALLAKRGVELFFTQVFRDSYFHADMHAGNIFVDIENPRDPRYIVVDFGIMGSLSEADQHYLACNLLAFFNRDYREVARLHIESGWVAKETRIEQFESAIRSVSEPIFERPLKEISFATLLLRLFQTAERFDMDIQPQLLLLQKTLFNIEGLGRTLYPELNLWDTAKPALEKWMRSKLGWRAILKRAKERSPLWSSKLAELPEQFFHLIEETSQARAENIEKNKAIELLPKRLTQIIVCQQVVLVAVVIAVLFLA